MEEQEQDEQPDNDNDEECDGNCDECEHLSEQEIDPGEHSRLYVWVVVIEEDSIQGKHTTVSNVFFDLEDAERYINFRYPLAKKVEDKHINDNTAVWKHVLWGKGRQKESNIRQTTIITVHKKIVVEDLQGPRS